MLKTATALLISLLFSGLMVQAQVRVKPNESVKDLPFDIKVDKVEELNRAFEPAAAPESQASLEKVALTDMFGNKVKPVLDRVTIIEYWSENGNSDNLYWNKMRELELKYKDSDQIQFLSINYDNVANGKYHRKAMQAFVKKSTPPQNLYLDKLNGFRDVFFVPGPVAYMIIDHRGQYIFGGRGDDPETKALFDKHIANCLLYQEYNKSSDETVKNN